MNKLFFACGMVFLGLTTTPQTDNSNEELDDQFLHEVLFSVENEDATVPVTIEQVFFPSLEMTPDNLDIHSIQYLEIEDEIELGFNTQEYLPEDFDPNMVYVDLKRVTYLKDTDEELEMVAKDFLPETFDAYAPPADFRNISYMEEEDLALGFDTMPYLPKRFDAHEIEFDLDSIEYIEEDINLDYSTAVY